MCGLGIENRDVLYKFKEKVPGEVLLYKLRLLHTPFCQLYGVEKYVIWVGFSI